MAEDVSRRTVPTRCDENFQRRLPCRYWLGSKRCTGCR
jgi:hypothetical protein